MKNCIFWRIYYTNQDGRIDYRDYTDKAEAIKNAFLNLYAWGYEDEAVKVKEYSIREIDFKTTV